MRRRNLLVSILVTQAWRSAYSRVPGLLNPIAGRTSLKRVKKLFVIIYPSYFLIVLPFHTTGCTIRPVAELSCLTTNYVGSSIPQRKTKQSARLLSLRFHATHRLFRSLIQLNNRLLNTKRARSMKFPSYFCSSDIWSKCNGKPWNRWRAHTAVVPRQTLLELFCLLSHKQVAVDCENLSSFMLRFVTGKQELDSWVDGWLSILSLISW